MKVYELTEDEYDRLTTALVKAEETISRLEAKMSDDGPFTIAEAAAYLKVTRQTISNYIDRNMLNTVEIGGRVLVLRSDLKDLLSRHYINRIAR